MSHEVLITRRQSIFDFFANPGRGGPQKVGAGRCWLVGMLRPPSAWICKKIKNALSPGYQDLMGHLILTTSPWSILTWITLLQILDPSKLVRSTKTYLVKKVLECIRGTYMNVLASDLYRCIRGYILSKCVFYGCTQTRTSYKLKGLKARWQRYMYVAKITYIKYCKNSILYLCYILIPSNINNI